MKVHVADIVIRDYDLMRDIVHALETNAQSGHSYEVEMREKPEFDLEVRQPTGRCECGLRIFRHEVV